jgi:hypothetical protein
MGRSTAKTTIHANMRHTSGCGTEKSKRSRYASRTADAATQPSSAICTARHINQSGAAMLRRRIILCDLFCERRIRLIVPKSFLLRKLRNVPDLIRRGYLVFPRRDQCKNSKTEEQNVAVGFYYRADVL